MNNGAGEEGRSCPLHYRYRPESLLDRLEHWPEDVIYVVGGLYGNPFALGEVEAMAAQERAAGLRVRLLFNGDFNWFNADGDLFESINHRVLRHDAMLGNVEYELANPAPGAGCGCAYPDFVDDQVVARSNRIMMRLQEVAQTRSGVRASLSGLARWRSMIFGGLKVLVLHGDPESLAGWGLSRDTLSGSGSDRLTDWFRRTDADLILCSHTCQPLLWTGEVGGRPRCVLNNGSAGMANLKADTRGLIIRMSVHASPLGSVATTSVSGLELSLEAVAYDHEAWVALFDELWPGGSDASVSYRQRITEGGTLAPSQIYLSQ
ncbi:hypothetical protein [Marinobacter salicampi]|uniref:hypothetical protein n=1 Tax=Marinobacter salicampi TaxID=435907 RepID=UPI00140D55F1|nr:hypothetical protein [Marinobacter salicampi]